MDMRKVEAQKMAKQSRPISLVLRQHILRRDKFTCRLCGRTAGDGIKLEVDHKTPTSKGGSDEESNLWTTCDACNRGKSNKWEDGDDAVSKETAKADTMEFEPYEPPKCPKCDHLMHDRGSDQHFVDMLMKKKTEDSGWTRITYVITGGATF